MEPARHVDGTGDDRAVIELSCHRRQTAIDDAFNGAATACGAVSHPRNPT